ncbi:MAG: hypothetical protein J6Y98_04850 [Bacteroidales bacterium]|nr:hypothetical protein [Bacteroidales bacterium]MCR5192875.1 hypothetical protein [Bacteroidales bacterium]
MNNDGSIEQRMFEARRRTLRIVLVLSMIGSGFYFISNTITGIAQPVMKSAYESGAIKLSGQMSTYTVAIEQMLDTPRSFFLCSALLNAMSLTGAILMWNLRKSGFHMYTLAQMLIMLITVLFLGRESMPLGDIMLTILFVLYYYISLRNLGAFNRTEVSESPTEENKNDEEE